MIKKIVNIRKLINFNKLKLKVGGGKALAIVGIAVGVIIIYYGFTWYASIKTSTYDKVKTRRTYLSRQINKLSEKNAIAKKLETEKNDLGELEKGLIKEDKPAVVAAELQRLCREIALSSGIDIKTERMLDPVDEGTYYTIPIKIEFQAITAGLKEMLLKIEQSPFLLTVPDLKVRVININDPVDIYVTMTVAGFSRKKVKQDITDKSKENKIRQGV
ncbi:MAG: hypothetical protein CVV37_04685 [Nitrospira bacterium HGW-Nitrospira-1]|nr:MAG: hypothetical protein CVV37_04685 [Nitrospira bacterium HGW-Nitrospira-1]